VHTGIRRFSTFRTEPLDRYEKGSKLAGVIYVHRISDNRFTGITGRNFKMFRELCGDTTLRNVVLVTNMWGEVSRDVGEARENELSNNFFKPVLDKGAQMVRHHNTAQSAHDVIRRIMKNRPVALQIQRELVDEHKDIIDTAAGEAVNRELNEQIRRHQAELKAVQEDMMQALNEKDEETRQELEAETKKLQEQMERIKKDSEGMASNYSAEKERMATKMRQMEQEAKKERQRAEAEYGRQMADLNRRLQEAANASAAERKKLQQEMKRLQDRLDESDDDGWCVVM
jgi:chromosome segregation ATPase